MMDLDICYVRSSLRTLRKSAQYLGCFQDTLYQDQSHLYNNSTQKMPTL